MNKKTQVTQNNKEKNCIVILILKSVKNIIGSATGLSLKWKKILFKIIFQYKAFTRGETVLNSALSAFAANKTVMNKQPE